VGIAARALACDETLVVPGQAGGAVNVSELITGPDAGNFTTSIACLDAAGEAVIPGTSADVLLAAGSDAHCAVVNLNSPLPPGGTPPTEEGSKVASTH
jgi:hypothetical protein